MYDKKDDVKEEITGMAKGSKYDQQFKEHVCWRYETFSVNV